MAETKEQQLEWKVSDKAEENSANTTPQDKESIDQKKKKAKKPMVTRAELQKFKTQHGESVDWKGFSSAQIILKKDAIDVLEFETSIVGVTVKHGGGSIILWRYVSKDKNLNLVWCYCGRSNFQ